MDAQQCLREIFEALFHIRTPDSLDYEEVMDRIEALANNIADTDYESYYDWPNIESMCHSSDVIVGAFWHFTEWHGGQYSDSYRCLCSLGRLFSPGMTSGPEPDSTKYDIYEYLNQLASVNA